MPREIISASRVSLGSSVGSFHAGGETPFAWRAAESGWLVAWSVEGLRPRESRRPAGRGFEMTLFSGKSVNGKRRLLRKLRYAFQRKKGREQLPPGASFILITSHTLGMCAKRAGPLCNSVRLISVNCYWRSCERKNFKSQNNI